MEEKRRSLELKVGLFTLFGMFLTATLAIYFGRATEPFKAKYPIVVHFDNASGLLKGSQVLLGGARIGEVTATPAIGRQEVGVIVPVEIYDHIKIPVDTAFKVRSSGLLGDAYIDVQPEKGLAEAEAYLEPGAVVEGSPSGNGIEGLASSGTDLVEDLKETNAELKRLLTRMNDEVITSDFVENIHGTAENARQVTADLDEDLEKITGDMQETLANLKKFSGQLEEIGGNAKDTTANLKAGSARLETTLTKVDDTVAGLDQTVQDLNALLADARTGDGLLPGLLNDEDLKTEVSATVTNLRALSANLKEHGVLFYRDTAPEDGGSPDAKPQIESREQPASERRARTTRRPGGSRR